MKLELSDKDQIRFLKVLVIFLSANCLGLGIAGNLAMKALTDQARRRLKLAQLNHRVVMRFVDLAPEEVTARIREEFEFDLATIDLDVTEDGKGIK
jgi:hypothetical protein